MKIFEHIYAQSVILHRISVAVIGLLSARILAADDFIELTTTLAWAGLVLAIGTGRIHAIHAYVGPKALRDSELLIKRLVLATILNITSIACLAILLGFKSEKCMSIFLFSQSYLLLEYYTINTQLSGNIRMGSIYWFSTGVAAFGSAITLLLITQNPHLVIIANSASILLVILIINLTRKVPHVSDQKTSLRTRNRHVLTSKDLSCVASMIASFGGSWMYNFMPRLFAASLLPLPEAKSFIMLIMTNQICKTGCKAFLDGKRKDIHNYSQGGSCTFKSNEVFLRQGTFIISVLLSLGSLFCFLMILPILGFSIVELSIQAAVGYFLLVLAESYYSTLTIVRSQGESPLYPALILLSSGFFQLMLVYAIKPQSIFFLLLLILFSVAIGIIALLVTNKRYDLRNSKISA